MTKLKPIESAPHGRSGAYEWWGGGMIGLTHWMPLPEIEGD